MRPDPNIVSVFCEQSFNVGVNILHLRIQIFTRSTTNQMWVLSADDFMSLIMNIICVVHALFNSIIKLNQNKLLQILSYLFTTFLNIFMEKFQIGSEHEEKSARTSVKENEAISPLLFY